MTLKISTCLQKDKKLKPDFVWVEKLVLKNLS